jgi:Calx-beta domain/Bacterial Ig domain
MKTFRFLISIVAALSFARGASAFSITAVTPSPGSYVAPFVEVQLIVDIATPGQPAFLYAASQVTTNDTGIHVDIYPDSGMLTAIGSIRETVTLGTFPVGTHPYEVVIHPRQAVNWGTRTNTGGFAVVQDVPTVTLRTTGWAVNEPCAGCPVAPTVIFIERTEPTNAPLTVYLRVDGTATAGEDYRSLPSSVEIPAGITSVQLPLEPFDDDLAEGPEVVRVALGLSSNYWMIPGRSENLFVIFDNESGAPAARLDIVSPTNGSHFGFGNTIQFSAMAVYTSNEVYGPVEFYADDQLVARSPVIATGRPPVPGSPSVHTAYWTNPPAGQHTIVARTQIAFSQMITSPPVEIIVEEPRFPLVSLTTWPVENATVLESCPPNALCAAAGFVLRRTGPTNGDLRVYLSYSGTATPNVDYAGLSNSIVIPAGRDSVTFYVVPKDDNLVEGPETIVADFTPVPGPGYIGDPAHNRAMITIVDNDFTEPVVVGIETISPISEESSEPFRRLPLRGAMRISRNGPGSDSLNVFVNYSGTAVSGVDYESLPFLVTIPAGSNSTVLPINPIIDNIPEGIETVVATISSCPPPPLAMPCFDFNVDPLHASATVFIRDDGITQASLAIAAPTNGASFNFGEPIPIEAVGIDLVGFFTRVEFFADDRKIGERSIDQNSPSNSPGPQTFTFVWRDAMPGSHLLTAIGTDNASRTATSAPVEIRIIASAPVPVVIVRATDCFAVEPGFGPGINTATFRLRRFGPTNDDLTVLYSLEGTAENGIDYELLPGTALIPAGNAFVDVTIRPLADYVTEGIETVVFRLEPNVKYRLGLRQRAMALISDRPWLHVVDDIRSVAGCFHLCFATTPGNYFRIEASTDLKNWETVFTGIAEEDLLHFADDEIQAVSCRFYRLAPEPAANTLNTD